MKKEIKDAFIELGLKGISPIELYNALKDIKMFAKEDFEEIRHVFKVRYDQMEIYLFCENMYKAIEYLENIETDELSIIRIDEIPSWEILVNSLDSREESLPFKRM